VDPDAQNLTIEKISSLREFENGSLKWKLQMGLSKTTADVHLQNIKPVISFMKHKLQMGF
jgi:hypothetical protein